MELIITVLIAACGGFFMGRTVSRFLAPAANRFLRVIPYPLLALTIANASWIGDENPIILFPFFGSLSVLLSGAMVFPADNRRNFFLPSGAAVHDDYTANFNARSVSSVVIIPLFGKLATCVALWLLSRRVVAEAGAISLSGKLWGLLGGLTLAPLFSTLSFTIWRARDLGYDAYKSIVYRIAYTILPFTMRSAVVYWVYRISESMAE